VVLTAAATLYQAQGIDFCKKIHQGQISKTITNEINKNTYRTDTLYSHFIHSNIMCGVLAWHEWGS
jgi:hypothetical protein